MKEITMYVSDDGKKFETLDECLKYEKTSHDMISNALELQKYCKFNEGCAGCVFEDGVTCSIAGSPWCWNIPKFQDTSTHSESHECGDQEVLNET